MAKRHLFEIVRDRFPKLNPKQVEGFIICGRVYVNQQKVTKVGAMVDALDKIEVRFPKRQYVSRGGDKLAGIWPNVMLDLKNKVVLDAGISTGGFADFLLQQGAQAVIGVDVAYGLTDYQLRNHPKVALIERMNIRHLKRSDLEVHSHRYNWPLEWIDSIQLVVMDVSFIHAKKCLVPIIELLQAPCDFLVLVKPQFEAKKSEVEKGGIIRDPVIHRNILDRVKAALDLLGLYLVKELPSPVTGAKGNQEVFFWLKYDQSGKYAKDETS